MLAQVRGRSSAKCQAEGSRDGVDLSAFSQFVVTEIQAERSRLDDQLHARDVAQFVECIPNMH